MLIKSLQLCPTLCDPMGRNLPGSTIHGILQARNGSGLPCLPPGDLPDPGIELLSLMSPALSGGFFTTSTTWVVPYYIHNKQIHRHKAENRITHDGVEGMESDHLMDMVCFWRAIGKFWSKRTSDYTTFWVQVYTTKSYTLKWWIACYMNFTYILKWCCSISQSTDFLQSL